MPYQNQFQPYQYQQYAPAVQPPMDRLAQLQAQQFQPTQANQSLIYVQGETAAKSWMVSAGQSVLLMDSENPVFYIKSADAAGIPLPLRIFDYKEREQNAPQSTQSAQNDLDSKYVTREEYESLQGKYMEILERLNDFPAADGSPAVSKRAEKTSSGTRTKGGNADE